MNGQRRHDVVTIPTIRIAFVVSILVHVGVLWIVLPHLRALMEPQQTKAASALAVELTPRSNTVASAAPAAPVAPPERASPPAAPRPSPPVRHKPAPPKRVPPPMVAQQAPRAAPLPPVEATPAPVAPQPAPAPNASPPPPAEPAPMPPPPATDLASYVDAQRRARGEAPAAEASAGGNAESDIARRDRIVAANLGLDRTPTFGNDERNAGGLFQITELGYDSAQFYFFGFDPAIRRKAKLLIDVRKGDAPDIRVAVVRKMIAIIREAISGDFVWVSQRLGRRVTLSARPGDNAGLEDFIMHDVFPDPRQP
jgi:hypothetical protein